MISIDTLISVVLGLIMFGIGASLRFSDFKKIFDDKRSFSIGITLQMLFLPLLAFVVAYFANVPPQWQVGLVIVAICPGGTTSNFISYAVNADAALSISLTIANSILILLTIPLFSSFAIQYFLEASDGMNISILDTFEQVLFILLIPAICGVLFNEKFHQISQRLGKPIKYLNTLLLAIVFGIKFFANEESGGSGITQTEILALLPYCLLIHFISMLLSYFVAKWLKVSNLQATTIGIEVGLQNTTLALLVAGTLIGNNEMTKPALVFAMFSFFTTLIFALVAMNKVKVGQLNTENS